MTAYRNAVSGAVIFHNDQRSDEITLPCRQCIGCLLERSRQWAIRSMHEASLHIKNCFITLTYRPEDLPPFGSLDYKHFQLFMKRLRKKFTGQKIKFYMCGEYGENLSRPHYHACLFGFSFPDLVRYHKTPTGDQLYTSVILNDLWGKGSCTVGEVNFKTAGYTARYCLKKLNGTDKCHNINYGSFRRAKRIIRRRKAKLQKAHKAANKKR
jgi:hypothetical protein